eukprot:Anaeramoba_ignava/c20412_g1_i2.p2 GENE.c20412_g1_i2~~c20412_g1_i2.p2  ORF type:complete len:330 (-),score=87.67 c20412_g1_i2:1450-2439(-)
MTDIKENKEENNEQENWQKKIEEELQNKKEGIRSIIKIQSAIRRKTTKNEEKRLMRHKRLREKAVQEVLSTERTYVERLQLLMEKFVKPLEEQTHIKHGLISSEQFKSLFSNIDSILFLHIDTLKFFEQRFASNFDSSREIADIFLKFVGFLKVYSEYCQNYDNSIKVLDDLVKKNQKFVDFIDECHNSPEIQGLNISSLLILPVQRIPRYNLLIQTILKYTPKEHSDYDNLNKALDTTKEISDWINTNIKKLENRRKMVEIRSAFDSSTSVNKNIPNQIIRIFLFLSLSKFYQKKFTLKIFLKWKKFLYFKTKSTTGIYRTSSYFYSA